ncbi:hypothetical protein DXD74_08825 [Bacteroides fragilis]|nr:hypothetical protein DXD74_08825 [Bacteroides fragilis]
MEDIAYFPKIIQYDIVHLRSVPEKFLQILVIRAIVSRQIVLLFPGISIGDVTAVVGGNQVHAAVNFYRAGIIENCHTPPHVLPWNTVMVPEQRDVRVLAHGHELSLFHYVTLQGKRAKIVFLSSQEHFLA